MTGKELIICIHNHRVYFNADLSIPIENTNIPKESFLRHKYKQFQWRVQQTSYSSEDKCLHVRLIEYDSDCIDTFHAQAPKSEKRIEKLLFENPDWSDLGIVLSGYSKINADAPQKPLDLPTTEFLFNRGNLSSTKDDTKPLQPEKRIVEEFKVDFTDIKFRLGYVSFCKKIKGFDDTVEFKIINQHLLAEFDNIKFWFSKILKTRKVKVIATITLRGNNIIETTTTSPDIDKINPELIDSVKYQRTFGLTKPATIKVIDKALFTSEDIFDQFDSSDESNIFNQTEIDIFALLSEQNHIRNRKQLQYLAGSKQTSRQKLRYTLHPNFGFVFLIEGERNNHFVWELLNSHATYMWSIGKSEAEITLQYKRVEEIINNVRTSGRDEYKRAYRNSHQDTDLVFNVIEHQQANSPLQDGFLKWKHKLNEKLV